MAGIDLYKIPNDEYVALVMKILKCHAILKTKYLRANEQPLRPRNYERLTWNVQG